MGARVESKPVVLLVDDHPFNIRTLANLLKENYFVMVANNGGKAIEIAAGQRPPDLILLDINMPEMDGYEVCRRLKSDERTHRIPVVFVTARNEAEDEEKGFLLGASDYIVKPFQPAVVRARVRNQVNLKLHADALEKLATVDGLTGIPNRRAYHEGLERIRRHSVRTNHRLGVLMIDVDHFKAFNDNYGHGAGDECLGSVAQVLKDVVNRPMDLIARYGGEEFSAVLPETDRDGALHVANRMLDRVRGLRSPTAFLPQPPS